MDDREFELLVKMLDRLDSSHCKLAESVNLLTTQSFEVSGALHRMSEEISQLRKGRADELKHCEDRAVERALDKGQKWAYGGIVGAALAIIMMLAGWLRNG